MAACAGTSPIRMPALPSPRPPPRTAADASPPAPVAHVLPRPLAERIPLIDRLLPYLRERGYRAGERLPSERELAQRFEVSRGQIREALAVLEATRLVERRPQSGVYLRASTRDAGLDALLLEHDGGVPLTERDVRNLYEFRWLLEIKAVEMAAERRTPDDLARIDAVLAESRFRLQQGLPLDDQDAQFHLAVFEATHNQFLVRTANWFYLVSGERRRVYFANARNGRRSLAQHVALRNAFAEADVAGAVQLMQQHLGGVENYWLSTLKPAGRR